MSQEKTLLSVWNMLIQTFFSAAAPGALFEDVIAHNTDLDMQCKMREDPLFAIRYIFFLELGKKTKNICQFVKWKCSCASMLVILCTGRRKKSRNENYWKIPSG